MFDIDKFHSTFAKMTTPPIEIGNSLIIGRESGEPTQSLPTIGHDESTERLVISNRKGNELVGIEICMKLNLLFVELPLLSPPV